MRVPTIPTTSRCKRHVQMLCRNHRQSRGRAVNTKFTKTITTRMIIPIKREDGSLNEWAIIELQGDLKHSTGDIKNAQFIGDLHFTESGVPILIIGIHVLYGKETALSKPFAVLEKIKFTAEDVEKTDMETEDCESTTKYIVKAIVKKKLIFKGRPKPIVTDVPICT